MLKSLVLSLFLISLVFANDPVRVKLTKHKKPVTKDSLHFGKPVNETLVDHFSYYTGEIHVGTPPKKFVVDFDTGSPDFWLTSKDCKYVEGGECKAQVNRYDFSASSTGKDLHQEMYESYGSGKAFGGWFSDNVGLTPDASGTTTKETFNFGVADKLKGFSSLYADGLFGLSFRQHPNDHQSFIEYLRDNNIFDSPIFTVWMEHNVSTDVLGGEIIFGAEDKDHCGEDLVTIPAGIKKPWWTFELDGVTLDGKEIGGKATAITDTGTTLLGVPSETFDKLAEKYPLSRWDPTAKSFNCGEHEDIKLDLNIGGKKFELGPKDLIFTHPQKTGKCFFGIFPFDDPDIGYLLGDPFVMSFCQIHNYKDETLTLALAKHSN